ncbi:MULTISPECIES: effector-associated domain 2-containing protein [unclassified Streptomyces]|uniref:phosphorylase family protein n=1 Tax=unclassified Streptomyces TaxID=2593676 RepID=UPI002DDAD89A|nr:nucleosidase [Streptomyces sp. NBC_00243]WRZ18994.1 5'-methylthioadenosine/S-adenosylhomocysteine nucleosidase [Streptomyces sp. NBC_00243]
MTAPQGGPPTLVLLTALPVEYAAVRDCLTEIQPLTHPSGTRAESGRILGVPWRIVLVETGAGPLNAAVLTERVHTWLHPEAAFFVGVAGALKEDIALGDVVVATKVYAYDGGKQTPSGFHSRPEAWHPSHRLEQAARTAVRGIAHRVHFKPVAVANVLLADSASGWALLLRERYNDAVAVEMESSGVAHAAHLTGELEMLVIRGISDHADDAKPSADASGSQSRAAANAAATAVAVLRELAPPKPVNSPASATVPDRVLVDALERISDMASADFRRGILLDMGRAMGMGRPFQAAEYAHPRDHLREIVRRIRLHRDPRAAVEALLDALENARPGDAGVEGLRGLL